MNVSVQEQCALTNYIFDVAKFNYSTLIPIPLLSSRKVSFPIVHLKNSSLPSSALKSPTKIFYMVLGKMIKHMFEFHIRTVLSVITFFLSLCMHIQNNNTSDLSALYDILSLTSPTLLTAEITLKKKGLLLIEDFKCLLYAKSLNPLLLQYLLCPTYPPAHPLNRIYTLPIPWSPS